MQGYIYVYILVYMKGIFITSTKEVMFLPEVVCLFVSLFVTKITQKLMDGF